MKKKYPRSFPRRITNRVIATVLVTMTVLSGWIFYHSVTRFGEQMGNHFMDVMEITNDKMDIYLSSVEVSAGNIEDELSYNLHSPASVCSALIDELRLNPYVSGTGVGFVPNYFPQAGRWFEPYAYRDSTDNIGLRQIGSQEHNYFLAEWYLEGMNHPHGYWSDPYFDKDGAGTLVCSYSLPVHDRKNSYVAVMATDLKLDWLKKQLRENDRTDNQRMLRDRFQNDQTYHTYSFIIGRKGEFIVHPDSSRILKSYFDYAPADDDGSYYKAGHNMMEGLRGSEKITVDGRSAYIYYSALKSNGWSMGIVVPTKMRALPGVLLGFLVFLIISIAVIVIALVCRISIRSATRPLVKLAASAEEVAKGNFDAELPRIRYRDEICLLRDSFENMQKSLSEYVRQLTTATAQRASLESELSIASDIQMSMLPKTFPDRDDVEIYASLSPAKAVGGDMYDFYLRDDMLFFCIGDVSGKGVPAALVMAGLSAQFRALSSQQTQPDLIISGLNSSISERNDSLMFVTFFAGMINLRTGAFHFCNAGHNIPVLSDANGVRPLDVEANVPLGIDKDWRYLRQNKVIEPGTTIILYTDGVTEAENKEHELFGEERMYSVIEESRSYKPKELVSQLISAVHGFADGAEPSDDITLLAIHYKR